MVIETAWHGRMASSVMTIYERARTVVRTKQGYSTEFEVKIGIHQGSVLSPLLFIAVDGSSDSRSKGRITMGTAVCR